MTTEKSSITKLKKHNNYLIVEINWSMHIVLPYEDGIKFMQSLQSAELLEHRHDKTRCRFKNIDSDILAIKVISEEEITDIKSAQLMGTSYKEYLDAKSRTTEST